MQHITPNKIFGFLIAVWTAIFLAFWSVIYVGGNFIVWVLENVFGAPGDRADVIITLLQNMGSIGLLVIWGMGAAMLFIMRRWLTGITKGPGTPYDVELQHDGRTIETSYTDVTEKR